MVEDPWMPLMKRTVPSGEWQTLPKSAAQIPDSRQAQHLPRELPSQPLPGYADISAAPAGVMAHVPQLLPPPGVTRQPLPPQSQVAAQLGLAGRRSGASCGANANDSNVSAELLLANAPIDADGAPLGRIFVGGLPQVGAVHIVH